ncbi:T9SS type A sorting domain-containing protein [bacterium SCSIO 12741]|nr:T9SS type A sorting domain-containing protein [bacterium SCSIO 12741]
MRYILTSILAIAALLLWWQQTELMLQADPVPEAREGTVVVSHEKSSFNRIMREQWIESMHRAEPGTDWRNQDLTFRIRQSFNTASRSASSLDTVHDGEWFERGSNNQSGRMVYALFSPDSQLITAASAGGIIWEADIDLLNWQPLNDQFRINNIVSMAHVQVNGQPRLVAASGDRAVYYSDDHGKTWSQSRGLENLSNWGSVHQMTACYNKSLFMVCNEWDYTNWVSINSLYYSPDGGENFQLVSSYDPNRYGPINYFDLHTIAQSDTFSLFLFRDSISVLDGKTGAIRPHDRVPIRAFGQGMLTGTRNNDSLKLFAFIGGYFYSSNGSGKQWAFRGNTTQTPFRVNSFSSSQVDTSALFFGAVECFRSTNGGLDLQKINSWQNYYDHVEDSLHADIPFIGRFEDDQGNEFHLIGTDGGLYISRDQLQSVKNLSLQYLNVSQYYSTYSTQNGEPWIYAGSQDQGFQRSKQKEQSILNYDQVISGDYGHLGSNDGGKSIWIVYPGFVGFYKDARQDNHLAASWSFNQQMESSLWLPPLVADPDVANKAYLIGVHDKNDPDKKSNIIEMTFSGSSITTTTRTYNFNLSPQKDEYLTALAISPIESKNWYALTNKGNFFFSIDGGKQWSRSAFFTGPDPHYFYGASIYASRYKDQEVWVAGSGYSNPPVYRSLNGGRDFTPVIDSLPRTLVYDITGGGQDSVMYAATEVGPYVWHSRTNRWYEMSKNQAPDQVYWSVEFVESEKLARFGTYGRGIWDFQIDTPVINFIPTPIAVSKTWKLYPNPADQYIHITTENPEDGLTISLFDQQGKRVLEQTLPSGQEKMVDVSGVSPGNYLLHSPGYATQKVLIQR